MHELFQKKNKKYIYYFIIDLKLESPLKVKCYPECGSAFKRADLAERSVTDVGDVSAPDLQDCVPFDIP